MEKMIGRVATALRALGAFQILAGICATLSILLFVSHEILEMFSEEIMMSGKSIELLSYLLMALIVVTGVMSLFKVRWGWIFSFTVGSIVLTMALLMGPGTITITKWSFLGLMLLAIISWVTAVLHYFNDLYT